MSTRRQIEANRRNAQKSTGPPSVTGKAASSMNALKTGIYAKSLDHRDSGAPRFLEIEAGFQPAFGSHVKREVTLMQRILDPDRLLGLLTTDIPAEMRKPGTWMHDALELRDRWESQLLRTATWSPLPEAVA